jgi:hypothetical protein
MLSWFTVITLMVEAARVIEMRLRLIALGRGTADEMFLMVTEKVKALEEAGAIILRGGNPSLVIDNYQKIVAANVARLSGVWNVPSPEGSLSAPSFSEKATGKVAF